MSPGHGPKKVEDANSAKNKTTTRQRIWNVASIVFGGFAIAYGISTEEHFATAAGAAIAAIGIIKIVKDRISASKAQA